jgi:hypothetical protein
VEVAGSIVCHRDRPQSRADGVCGQEEHYFQNSFINSAASVSRWNVYAMEGDELQFSVELLVHDQERTSFQSTVVDLSAVW